MNFKARAQRVPFAWPVILLSALALFVWAIAELQGARPAEQRFQSFVSRMTVAQYAEARGEIEGAVRLSPGNAYYISGQALLHERMVQARFEPEAYLANRLALGEEDKGRVEAAIRYYEMAVELSPNDGNFNHNLGWLYCFAGRREKAVDCFKRAIEIDGASALYHVSLGLFYEQSGMHEEACDEYSVAVRLSPGVLDSTFFSDFKRRSPSGAEQVVAGSISYLESRLRQSDDAMLKARLGKMYLYSGRPEAAGMLRQATTDLPSLSRPWLYLGKLYEAQSSEQEARRCYERAAFLDASDFLSPLELARLNDRDNMPADAIRYYQSAINNWLLKPSASARKAQRRYFAPQAIHDDVVPEGLLSYVEPSFDLAGTCFRLSALYRDAGEAGLANHYENLSRRSPF